LKGNGENDKDLPEFPSFESSGFKKSEVGSIDENVNNEFNRVFRDYKRQSAGVISEFRKKEMYIKPSDRRKLKRKNNMRKKQKNQNKNDNSYKRKRGNDRNYK